MIARIVLVVLLAVGASACSFGAGSAYVGEWRPRRVVAARVCLEDARGHCKTTTEVSHEVPARRFWGFAMDVAGFGVSRVTRGDQTATALRIDLSAEMIRGRGRFAWGVRADGLIDAGTLGTMSAVVMATGHVGINDRFGVYGGLGISPLTRVGGTEGVEAMSYAGGRSLVGVQAVLGRIGDTRVVLGLDADYFHAVLSGADQQSVGGQGRIMFSF